MSQFFLERFSCVVLMGEGLDCCFGMHSLCFRVMLGVLLCGVEKLLCIVNDW